MALITILLGVIAWIAALTRAREARADSSEL
jgi:hypothetical protein